MTIASRGLLAGVAEGTLEAKIKREPYDKLWRYTLERTKSLLDRADASPCGLITYGALGSWSMSGAAIDAALVWRLTGDKRALGYVERCIDGLATYYGPPGAERDKIHAIVIGGLPYHSHAEVPLAADLCRAGLSKQALDTLARGLLGGAMDAHDDGGSLRGYGAGANVPFARNVCAAVAALVWGEELGHPHWKRIVDVGRDNVIGYFRRGLDAKGYPYEGPGYAGDTSYHLYLVAQILRQRGMADLFADEPACVNFVDAMLTFLFPDRSSFGNVNDLGFFVPWSLPFLPLTARYARRPDHLGFWEEFQGPDNAMRPYGDFLPHYERTTGVEWSQGCHVPSLPLALLWWDASEPVSPIAATPVPLAVFSPGTENSVCRTSWSADAVFANFQGGGRGHVSPGHVHSDSGHFSIFAHGDYLAMDTGRYNTDEDQHNVVLVDGKCHMPIGQTWGSAHRSGRMVTFQRHAMLDYAVADAAHTKNAIWADRHFLFVRTGGSGREADHAYVVVIDNINVKNARGKYLWQLHTPRENALEIVGADRAVVRGPRARLDIDFVLPSPEDFPKEPHTLALRTDEKWWTFGERSSGWADQEKLGLYNCSVRRPRLLAEFEGLNGVMMTVISPRRKDEPARAVHRQSSKRVMRVEVEHETGVDTILAAIDNGYMTLPDVEGFAELVVLRRDRAGRLLDMWTKDGERLRRVEEVWPRG
ncbi:MAG: heparinase II/III family protein [Planctomycetota bacterium]|nr:heparinase II/III family protein [Planctomycetota bacterium]